MFLWAFVPAAFVVTGNVAFPIGAAFAERLAYLPLAGFCGLGGYLVTRALTSRRAVALSVALLLALAGAWRTARRSADFRDLATFVEATAAASPRSVKALANAGRTRLRLGRPADAVEPLETAVALWPEYTRALELLAEAYARLGERERAEAIRARAHSAAAFEGAIDAPLGE
jgi:tetratricopeptide (TPR) repeat protein